MFRSIIFYTVIFQLICFYICIHGFPSRKNQNIEDTIENNDNELKLERIRSSNLSSVLKEHVENMIRYMNRSVDPCENFHQYACGNWQKYHELPPDHGLYDLFHKLNDNLRSSLHYMLTLETNLITTEPDVTKSTEKVKMLFESCLDTDKINERKSEPLLKFLKKFGGFPLLNENWSENDFHIENMLVEMSLHDMETFFGFSVFEDFGDLTESNKFQIYVWEISLGLPSVSDYFYSEYKMRLSAYRNLMIEIFKILNADENKIEKVVDEIINLEIRIANETIILKDFSLEEAYMPTTIGTLNANYPKFNWTLYFNSGFNTNFNNDTKIIFFTGPNVEETYNILFETEKRIIANYINWIVIHKLAKYLDERFKPALKIYSKAVTGAEPDTEDRGLSCTTTTNQQLGMAVGAMYVKNNFQEASKIEISQIAEKIIDTFRQNLYDYDWLDVETKLRAEKKVNKTALAIGYPDFLLNKTALDQYYADLFIESGKYFENIVNIRKLKITNELKKLGRNSIDFDEDWRQGPTVVNAYFENAKNRILLPASILQPPIYHNDFSNAIKYGAIGVFIGHELTHGFDSSGRIFNENGKFKNWWSNNSLELFTEKEQCFIDQYDEFSLYNESLSGELSKGENIADNAGIQLAFKVFNNWLTTSTNIEKEAEILPGLEFLSSKQIFFLSYAQSWCDYIRPEAAVTKSLDAHPPGSVRILGALQNFDEFSKAFQCSKGSKMNSFQKCKLW